jgi:hypothetical protein
MLVAMYLRTGGRVSMWSYIHLHMAVDTHAEFGYAAWASAQSLVMRYGQWSESGYALWVSAQNMVMCRIIDESTESHKFIQKKLAVFFKGRVRRKIVHGINCTSQGLYYPYLKPPTRLENILILRRAQCHSN